MDDNPYHQKYDYNNDDLNHVTGVVGLFPIDSDIINKLLKGDEKMDFPIPRHAILRAQANPQRFPEIWAFESEMTQIELKEIAEESPQVLADGIRRCGQNVFKTHKPESVIV